MICLSLFFIGIRANDLDVIKSLEAQLLEALETNEAYFAKHKPLELHDIRNRDVYPDPKRPSETCPEDACYPESCLEYQYLHFEKDGYYKIDPKVWDGNKNAMVQQGSEIDVKCVFDVNSDDSNDSTISYRKRKPVTELYFNRFTEEYSTYVGGVWQCQDPPYERNLFEDMEMHTKYHLSKADSQKVINTMEYCEQQIDAECSMAEPMAENIIWLDMNDTEYNHFHGNDSSYNGCQERVLFLLWIHIIWTI